MEIAEAIADFSEQIIFQMLGLPEQVEPQEINDVDQKTLAVKSEQTVQDSWEIQQANQHQSVQESQVFQSHQKEPVLEANQKHSEEKPLPLQDFQGDYQGEETTLQSQKEKSKSNREANSTKQQKQVLFSNDAQGGGNEKGIFEKEQKKKLGNVDQNSESSEEEEELGKESQNPRSQLSQYLYFRQGQQIIVTHKTESGWWYGELVDEVRKGYFPSNYIRLLSELPKQTSLNLPEEEIEDWSAYAKKLIEEEQIKQRTKENEQTFRDHFKKIHGKDEEYEALLRKKTLLGVPDIEVDEASGFAYIPIKDQTPLAKDLRQINHYFDYDQWIEERNANPTKKAKPNPSKKVDKLKKKIESLKKL